MKNRISVFVFTVSIFALVPFFLDAANAPAPDAKIGKKPGALVGDDVYSTNGTGQRVGVKANKKGKAKYSCAAQNDDPIAVDTLTTLASRRDKKFVPRYLQISPAAGNVTAAITTTGHVSGPLASGGMVTYRVVVRTKRKFRDRRTKKTFTVRVSAAAGGTPDTALAAVKKKR